MNPDLTLTCKIISINDLEVFSTGVKKITVVVMALHRRKVENFEIIFYNKYINEAEKMNSFGIYKIQCLIHSEVFIDRKTEEKTYFTHLIGIKVDKIGNV